jgi:hypothetical protein
MTLTSMKKFCVNFSVRIHEDNHGMFQQALTPDTLGDRLILHTEILFWMHEDVFSTGGPPL